MALGKEQGLSIRAIARMLGRAASSISRELCRNQPSLNASYSCTFARPAPKLAVGSALFEQVRSCLHLGWSPEKIAAHLSKLHPCQAALRASHESIYNIIYARPRGELKRELLRMARAKRWPRSRGKTAVVN